MVFVTMTLADEHHFQVTKVAPGYGEGRRIGEFIPFVGSMPEGTAIAKAVTYRLRFEEEQERAGDRFTAHCIQSIGGTESEAICCFFPVPTDQVPHVVYDAVDQYAREALATAALASRPNSE